MKLVDELAKRTGPWLGGSGSLNDVVISSRIRLARNLAQFPFLTRADDGQRRQIYRQLYERIMNTDLGSKVVFVDIDEAPELDRQVLVDHIKTLDQWKAESVAQRQFLLRLIASFAGLALLLTVVGIYGVMAYATTRRTHEIGIRVALGARGSDIVSSVLRQGLSSHSPAWLLAWPVPWP